jgi:hypothetical protein
VRLLTCPFHVCYPVCQLDAAGAWVLSTEHLRAGEACLPGRAPEAAGLPARVVASQACQAKRVRPTRFDPLTVCPPARTNPAAPHPLAPYLSLMRTDGRLVMVGLPPKPLEVPAFALTAREWRTLSAVAAAACCLRAVPSAGRYTQTAALHLDAWCWIGELRVTSCRAWLFV